MLFTEPHLLIELVWRLPLLVRDPLGPELYLALGGHPVGVEGLQAVGVRGADRQHREGRQGHVDVLVRGASGLVQVLPDALPGLQGKKERLRCSTVLETRFIPGRTECPGRPAG